MLTTTQAARLAALTVADIRTVYSGRIGCACGCRGKHTTNPAHRAEATRVQGYAIADGECSERGVKRVLALVQAPGAKVEACADGEWFSVETETRLNIIYLCDAARAVAAVAA
jgi:hypothetical protein